MYFFSVFVMVHYEAKMYNIVGERSEHSAMEILKKEWFYTLPLVVITIFMLSGYSPGYSAILGLATCIVVSYKKETRIDYTLAVVMALVLTTHDDIPVSEQDRRARGRPKLQSHGFRNRRWCLPVSCSV
jgi:TRAP-type uncharacterized transport system fused permease subunit